MKPTNSEHIAVAPFGAEYMTAQQLSVACVYMETESREVYQSLFLLSHLLLHHFKTVRASVNTFQYLQGLKLAHPIINEDNFQISVLIGEEFYWTFVEDNIVRGDGLTAQQSKLGYLLSGPTQPVTPQCTTISFHVAVMKLSVDSDPIQFWSLEETGTVHTISFTSRNFLSLTSTPLVTKREILRDSAQIYDPLGLLAPVTVKAKILVQTLWKQKLDWDEPLDQELTKEWSTIEATSITYPRLYYMPNNQLSSQTTQLHIFVDASLRAYGAVVTGFHCTDNV